MESLSAHVRTLGSGLPLVLVHGNGVDHRLLLPLDAAITGAGEVWQRHYLDLPGFGGTAALEGRAGLSEMADWVERTLVDLVGERPVALVGSSMGGLLVREMVARRGGQVRAVALLAPVVDPVASRRRRPSRGVVEQDEGLLAALSEDDRAQFVDVATRQTRASWEAFEAAALPGIHAADQGAMERLAAHYDLGRLPEEVAVCQGPTLIVAGRQDHVVGYEDQTDLALRHPRSTLLVLDAAGHNVHLEQPAQVDAAMSAWAVAAAEELTRGR